MAKIGRPVLFRGFAIDKLGESISLYQNTMFSAGFDEAQVDKMLDQCWVWYESHLADTNEQAWDEFLPAFERASKYMAAMREKWNPPSQEISKLPLPLHQSAYGDVPNTGANEVLVGSPGRVSEQVELLRDIGVRNLMLTNRGLISREQTTRYLTLLSEKVMPLFRR